MSFLRLFSKDDFEAAPLDGWGIPDVGREVLVGEKKGEGRGDAMSEDADGLDIILVPGVAFDTTFGRLGHGKGFYDRYIQRYRHFAHQRGRSPPVLVALALQDQLLSPGQEVPMTEEDERMDYIVHPGGVMKRNA